MAQNTAINISFQARDWELLIGWIGTTNDTDLRDFTYKVQKSYEAVVPALNTTIVTISSTEGTAVKIYQIVNNATAKFFVNSGANPWSRITTAIKALVGNIDGYLTAAIAAEDLLYNNASTKIRKDGREIVMIRNYDNA